MISEPHCTDYYFYYMAWVAARVISETDGLEAKVALDAHAENCDKCKELIFQAWRKSKPLPEVDHV